MTRINFFHQDYLSDYVEEPFRTDARNALKLLGVTILTVKDANEIRFQKFFDSLCTNQNQEWPFYECLPVTSCVNLPIPYDTNEHFERKIGDHTIDTVVEEHVNKSFSDKKYLFSGDPNSCLALEFNTFTYEILSWIFSGNLNNPFVLFDEKLNQCFLFHFDLCLTIYCRDKNMSNLQFAGQPDSFWVDYFNDHFVEGIVQGNHHHLNIINQNYVPRLNQVKKLTE